MSGEIVDSAWEIASVIRKLARASVPPTDPTWSAVRKALGQNLSASQHWELMSALNSRLLRLDAQIRSVQDQELDQAQRQRALQAVQNFANLLEPPNQSLQWQQAVNFVREDDALQLSWFSVILKRHRPLRRVTDDEREELIAKIGEVVTALQVEADFPDWAKYPLSEGLQRLQFMLQHFVFFGCEVAIDQLLDVYSKASALENAIEGKSSSEKSTKRNPTLVSVLNVIVLVANLFWLPDQVTTAFERYRGWTLRPIIENPRLPKPETRLLAPPAPAPHDLPESSGTVAIEPAPPREEEAASDRAGE